MKKCHLSVRDGIELLVIGKFKDETAGVPIDVFIGLKSKMYSVSLDSGKNSKKA